METSKLAQSEKLNLNIYVHAPTWDNPANCLIKTKEVSCLCFLICKTKNTSHKCDSVILLHKLIYYSCIIFPITQTARHELQYISITTTHTTHSKTWVKWYPVKLAGQLDQGVCIELASHWEACKHTSKAANKIMANAVDARRKPTKAKI